MERKREKKKEGKKILKKKALPITPAQPITPGGEGIFLRLYFFPRSLQGNQGPSDHYMKLSRPVRLCNVSTKELIQKRQKDEMKRNTLFLYLK